MFPEGNQLGGAPANFAYMTNLLGDTGGVASCVGGDDLGGAETQRLARLRLPTSAVQLDPVHPTGVVKVDVDPAGQPTFHIGQNVAWDFFEWTPAWRSLAESANAVCFGSLAQRSPHSRQTIHSSLNAVRPGTTRVFDVNLRQSFYSAQVLEESSRPADAIQGKHNE